MRKHWSLWSRLAKFVSCFALAVALVWRSLTFADPHAPGVLVPLMCVGMATFVTLTGITIGLRGEEHDLPFHEPVEDAA